MKELKKRIGVLPSTTFQHSKSGAGFTLIELIVVSAIVAIFVGIGFTTFFEYARTQTLQAAANSVITLFNDARSRSLSQVKDSSCPPTGKLDGYKVVVNGPKTYDLYVVCAGVDYKIGETKSLPDKITFSGTTSTSFLFSVLSGKVVGPGTIVLSGYGKTRVVTVDPIGLIIAPKVMPSITLSPFPTPTPTPTLPTPTPTPTPGGPTSTPTPTPVPFPSPSFVATWGFGVKDGASAFQICYDPDPPCRTGISGASAGQFQSPSGIAADSEGNIYVADTSNHRIQKFGPNGDFLSTWGTQGASAGQFQSPSGIAVDSKDRIYVADTNNHRIQRFTASGTFLTKWGHFGDQSGEFINPRGIAVDSKDNIYVADTQGYRIQRFTSSGTFLTKWGYGGNLDGEFNLPRGIAVDSQDNIYVADTANNRIQKFGPNGNFLTKWGTQGSLDGQFQLPSGIAADSQGNIYVADTINHRIQRFGPNGNFLTKWGTQGSLDGQFQLPSGIAARSNNIFVADTNNHRIQKFSYLLPTPTPTPTSTPTPTPTPTPPLYRRVFVTSLIYNGNLGGLAGGDAKCQARASIASLGGTWVAWLSTTVPLVYAIDRIPDKEYRLVDNTTVIAINKADLADGTINAQINKYETGAVADPAFRVWTGKSSIYNCSQWLQGDSSALGRAGCLDYTDNNWTYCGTWTCDEPKRLYCFEQ